MSETFYKCGICGHKDKFRRQLQDAGWLIEQKRNAPRGELVIRCPDCRSVNSERIAVGFEPEQIFYLDRVRESLDDAEPYVSMGSDEQLKGFFLGTVFAVMPSGKYYMPFACSNVTEAEAEEDEEWRKQAEEELDSIGAWLESGEGDPCDLFVVTFAHDAKENEYDV